MTTLSDFKETVRQQADIVRVIGDYIQLKKAGAKNFNGLCPFHNEKSPSFSVNIERQFFHCFGCGKSGDVFKFVQEREQISFPEAIRLVAEKAGIPLPKMQYSSESEAEDAGKRGRLIEMHERACKFFEDQLRRPEGAHAREYLAGRGLKEETIRTFRIGFAPDSGFTLRDRIKADFSEEMMRASGLFSWKEGADGATTPERAKATRSGDPGPAGGSATTAMYSKFRNRILFPIANENGKIIAFTGRTLATDDKSGPKYLNSPETPIYSKSRVLYNLDRAKEAIRKLGYVIIVEGQMDCIAVYSAGFHNVAASSGTAFTETQVRLLGRFSKDIVVNFDPDTAGAAATDKSLGMLLEEEFNIRVLRLEAGFDPDLFIRKNGPEAYAKALKGSAKYFDYLVERALKLFPVRSPEGKKNAVNFLLPHIHRVPNRIVRDELANDIAQKLNIDTTVLRQEFKAAAVSRAAGGLRNQPDEDVTPAEKVLVRAASSMVGEEAELRHMAVDALAEERLHAGLTTETLLEAILQNALAIERGEGVDDVMALPLSDANRQRLAKIVMREDEPLTADLLAGALNALRHQRQLSQREGEIKRGIVEAERRNDVAALLRLKQEKLELDRKLASGG
ncbi:MAG: primase [Candidatus Angelobacter sp.]|nr:primase [Candidatus Angelobacter sp.]